MKIETGFPKQRGREIESCFNYMAKNWAWHVWGDRNLVFARIHEVKMYLFEMGVGSRICFWVGLHNGAPYRSCFIPKK